MPESNEVPIWDPFVRIAHWTVAIAFFVAISLKTTR
jgi:cytochrome b